MRRISYFILSLGLPFASYSIINDAYTPENVLSQRRAVYFRCTSIG